MIGTCPVCGVDRDDLVVHDDGLWHDHLETCPECGLTPNLLAHDSYDGAVARLNRAGRQLGMLVARHGRISPGRLTVVAECVVWWREWGRYARR